MNNPTPEQDFKAAVIQLRRGRYKNWLKFISVMILLTGVLGIIISLTLTIGDSFKAIIGQ
jgi:archaellum biogenesis protein FlaJ (TadC family)